MKKFFILSFLLLVITGCGNVKNSSIQNEKLNIDEINEIMSMNEYVIIDVRTKEEYDSGHLKDALNMPYDMIDSNIDLDQDKIIFVYCKSGKRSNMAYNSLKNLGYEVYDLGGLDDISLPRE